MAHLLRSALAVSLLGLAACSGDQSLADQLGLGRNAPDEFQVVERAPLTLPPEFSLRPPEPGVTRPQEGTTSSQAQQALLGGALPATEATPGQTALLASAGADEADPEIRGRIVDESSQLAGLDESRFWFILDFQRRAYASEDGTPVDARAEAQRLNDAGVTVRSTRVATEPLTTPGGG